MSTTADRHFELLLERHLGRKVRDSDGRLTPRNGGNLEIRHASWSGCVKSDREMMQSLTGGSRIVIPIALNSSIKVVRLLQRLTARLSVARAVRYFRCAQATRIRTMAVVPGNEVINLIYELGNPGQDYVEYRMILQPPRQSLLTRIVKSSLRLVSGVDFSADLLVVVGERA